MTNTHFPNKICKLWVYNGEDAILCDLWNPWSHIICIKMTNNEHKKLENDTLP